MTSARDEIFGEAAIEQLMLESWLPVAQKHAENSGGDISVLEIDPEQYPAQRLDTFHIKGFPQAPKDVEFAATKVERLFPVASEAMTQDPVTANALGAAGEILAAGGNLILATDHTKLTNVVMAQAAIYNYLKNQGRIFEASLVISKMISLLASNRIRDPETGLPVPGVLALQVVSDDIFLSYPRSETTSKTVLAQKVPDVMDAHNKTVREAIEKNLKKGGVLFAMAPSGTTDALDEATGICTMQEVQPGTAQLMAQDNAYVLPIAAYFGEHGFIRASGEPRQLSSPGEAHEVMESIAHTLTANVPDTDFVYR